MTADDLGTRVEQFAAQTSKLLQACFDDTPALAIVGHDDRYVVEAMPVMLAAHGTHLGELNIQQRFCLDSSGTYLTVEQSKYVVKAILDRSPIFRFEFDRFARKKPASHIQVHAERGALSHVLSQTGHRKPHAFESLHLPTGGARFRPALEDVIEFLIADCGFDAKQGWRSAVTKRREEWRRIQARSVVRDTPNDAAEVLRNLGYTVTPPEPGEASDNIDQLRTW